MSKILSIGKTDRAFRVEQHYHDYWELIYCTSGNGCVVSADGQETSYALGDMIIIAPDVLHSNISDAGFSNIYLTIDENMLPFNGIALISDNSSRHILKTLNLYYYYANNDTINKKDILHNLCDLLVNLIIGFSSATRYSLLVDKIRNEILKNFADKDFDIDTVLKVDSYNMDYLRKLFKKECGITPLQYLTNLRISSARKLLLVRNIHRMSITEIANHCGFSDSLYFSRVFKKHTGLSPNQITPKQ